MIFETDEYPDELYSEVLDNMYLPMEESYNGQRTWDVSQFEFEFSYMDIKTAAKLKDVSRSDVIVKEALNVYPNPSNGQISFNSSSIDLSEALIKVYAVDGKLVAEKGQGAGQAIDVLVDASRNMFKRAAQLLF